MMGSLFRRIQHPSKLISAGPDFLAPQLPNRVARLHGPRPRARCSPDIPSIHMRYLIGARCVVAATAGGIQSEKSNLPSSV